MSAQRERILAEMDHLLGSPHAADCDRGRLRYLRAKADEHAREPNGLVELIWASLRLRHELVTRDPSPSWRQLLSYIGRPPEAPCGVLQHEYMRVDQRLHPDAPWTDYYPWLRQRAFKSAPVLHNSGMASIASWFLALRHATRDLGHVTVVATRLYFETRELLQRLLPSSQVELVECGSDDEFLRRVSRQDDDTVIAYLDSAETADTVDLFRRLCRDGIGAHVKAIAWDNTLVPYWLDPFAGDDYLPVPLFLLRSLHKLDQFGLEIASVGLLTTVAPAKLTAPAAAVLKGVLGDIMIATKVIGATASPTSLRLLHGLELPNETLVRASNEAAWRSTARLAERLEAGLRAPLKVVNFPHGFFATVRCSGHDEPAVHRIMDDVVATARTRSLPIERVPSVGFSFTGMSTFTAPDLETGEPVTYLRLAAGGHDDPVTDEVADTLCEVLQNG